MYHSLALFAAFAILLCPASAKPNRKPPAQLSQIPAWFEPNLGQASPAVRFLSRKAGVTLALLPDAAVFDTNAEQIRLVPLDANPNRTLKGLGMGEGRTNYLKGEDRSRWLTNVPHFSSVLYEALYPGIDMMYYGSGQQYEFDLIVSPSADPGQIAFRIDGANRVRVETNGDLLINGIKSTLRLHKPLLYQPAGEGRKKVEGGFRVQGDIVRFHTASYDRQRPLIIDPVATSSYLGGRDVDLATAATVDSSGNYYITGYSTSTDLLRSAGTPYKSSLTPGDGDAFVAKLNSSATAIVYMTYVGGPNADSGRAIAVDSAGAVYLTGSSIGQFPTTSGAFRQITTVSPAIYVAKLNATGSGLVYATYLDGAGAGLSLQVDSSGNAYVAGYTYTASFTTTSGAFQRLYGGTTDAFVTKLDPNGATQVYSTFLGGSSEDQATAIRIDSSGAAYVAGFTASSNFPIVAGSYRTSAGGNFDGFLTKISANGATLTYSTYLGGSAEDRVWGLAIDASGNAYLTGQTSSSSFPTTAGVVQTALAGTSDAFVTKVNSAGTALVYSTLLGGTGSCTASDPFGQYPCDTGRAVIVDSSGQATVTGLAGSGFPTFAADQSTTGGSGDAFVAQLNATAAALVFSTFLGGGAADMGLSVVSPGGTVTMVVGVTRSTDFPVTTGAIQTTNGGGTTEGFFTRYGGSCSYSFPGSSSFFPNNSATYSAPLTATAGCAWTATTNVNWVTINTPSGTGSGNVSYSLTANPGGLRTGTITVGNGTSSFSFTLNQVGGACVITLGYNSSWFPQGEGFYNVPIFVSNQSCTWEATSSYFWITVTYPTGVQTGNGTAYFYLNANANATARTGMLNVSGQTVTINQVGTGAGGLNCGYVLSKQADTQDSYGGSSSLWVATTPGCEWVTVNPNSWITITAGFAGSGEGLVGYTVTPNPSPQSRIAQVTVAGQPVTIFQSGRQ